MGTTDVVADMLTRIRNASGGKVELVDIPWSNFKEQIAGALTREGFIFKHETLTRGKFKFLRVFLKYRKNKNGAITLIKRISLPGRRIYVKASKVPHVLSGYGIAILSTPKGVLSDSEAREQKVGGEVLCCLW